MNEIIVAFEAERGQVAIELINTYLNEAEGSDIIENNYHLLLLDKIKGRISREKNPPTEFIQAWVFI